MGSEINADSIRALEMQIEEGKGDIIKLKRARNSLLNISTRIPPEVLGYIFAWSLVREYDWFFGGLEMGSYNFLLVCHHWFEIASCTPELWSFWGNTLQDWKKRHHRSGATPLDLVLREDEDDPDTLFDESLQGAVRSHVTQDTIRQVHLISHTGGTLTSIISALTPDGEGGQNENIKSIIWRNQGYASVDVSNFFARSRLSRLHYLDISGMFRISSWDHLASRTTFLTTLSITIRPSPLSITPTASQLFSILISNPNLQRLTLDDADLPDDSDGSTFEVPLRHLKKLSLRGEFRRIFWLLHQLILPETLDHMNLTGFGCTVEDVSQTLVPYMRDYFRRNARFQDRLELSLSSSPDSIGISVTVEWDESAVPEQALPNAKFKVKLADQLPPEVLEQLFINLVTLIPREHVVHVNADLHMKLPEELFFMMPNIEKLYMVGAELSTGFLQPNPDGPHANMKLLPSLESLHLEDAILKGGGWSHLVTYLTHQGLDGQTISLEMVPRLPRYWLRPEVVHEIKGLVREFICPGTE